MATIREAAQALLVRLAGSNFERWEEAISLRAALAAPEPDRWTEGAEAMREALADYHEVQATEADGINSEGSLDESIAYHERETKRILATPLPVPPATTAAEVQVTQADGINSEGSLDESIAYHERETKRILATPLPVPPATTAAEVQVTLSCGCVTCVCADPERCHGCGSKESSACQASRLAGSPRHVAPKAKPAESEERALLATARWLIFDCAEGRPINVPAGYDLVRKIDAVLGPAAPANRACPYADGRKREPCPVGCSHLSAPRCTLNDPPPALVEPEETP